MVKTLAVGWTVWKLVAKRLGPVGGTIAAMIAIVGYVLLSRWLDNNHPRAAKVIS